MLETKDFAKDKLAKAFVSHLMEKDTSLDHLTISHLTDLAKINRVTFYRNFTSLEDFIYWFLLKDLIFKVDQDETVDITVAFSALFDYIEHFRVALRKIIASKYGLSVKAFILKESTYYQRISVSRIDKEHVTSDLERTLMVDFYGMGITHFILLLIQDPVYETMDKASFLKVTTALIKNYIEETMQKLKA